MVRTKQHKTTTDIGINWNTQDASGSAHINGISVLSELCHQFSHIIVSTFNIFQHNLQIFHFAWCLECLVVTWEAPAAEAPAPAPPAPPAPPALPVPAAPAASAAPSASSAPATAASAATNPKETKDVANDTKDTKDTKDESRSSLSDSTK